MKPAPGFYYLTWKDGFYGDTTVRRVRVLPEGAYPWLADTPTVVWCEIPGSLELAQFGWEAFEFHPIDIAAEAAKELP